MSRSDFPAVTQDAFHRGKFHLIQPAAKAHRAGVDAMLLAAAAPDGFDGAVADLGAGAGAAGLAVLSRCAEARAALVERDALMAECARRTLQLPGNEAFRDRVEVIEADVMASGRIRLEQGLEDNRFDLVIMNPPFNHGHDRATPHETRRLAHVMVEGMFEAWVRTAAAISRSDGMIVVIARPESLSDILAALDRRFGCADILPVHPREAAAAIRVIIRARKGARGPLSILPPLVLHGAEREFTTRANRLINGEVALFADR
ncbi:tRNA1(Val) (adenine(37)-N6)-methyltransferase [Nitratireductor basaltis]|uniref:Methyltransferase small n=1 Tax=Nitratireductor basaltis TaxID=472175 RepID=A0A084UCV7_9HYPH|nr:methyltransferase [Nitratireductor basaltis]KFB10793.1 Methyltransferase small [Nitratireductor basaltis]